MVIESPHRIGVAIQTELEYKQMECLDLELVIGQYQEQDNYGKKHIHSTTNLGQEVCAQHE